MMHGEKFSVIPLTTHINIKEINKTVKKSILNKILKDIFDQINRSIYKLKILKNKISFVIIHIVVNMAHLV